MRRTIIGLILVVAIFTSLGALGWYFVKDRVRLQQEYLLSVDKIVVSPPPDWIPDQFIEIVLRRSGLYQKGSLLDKTLPKKLTEAFAAYPWIENVEQVVPRYPSGAEVKLTYRVPVAIVDVPQRGMIPIDRYGVLLPSEYLTDTISDQWNKHIIIQGIQSLPLGSAGTPWGDVQVQMAAQLAAALSDIAEPLRLKRIVPTMETTMETLSTGVKIECQLITATNMEIHWGTFEPNDPKTEAKKKRLWNIHEQFQSLDNVPSNFRPIDLRKE